jgi:DMSO/TMAO reductase YedYZ heme-binding membrane subunit
LEIFMTATRKGAATDPVWGKAHTIAIFIALGMAGALIFLVGGWLLANSAASTSIGEALAITAQTPWYFSRSAGTVAYALLAGSTIWGLFLSTKLLKESVPAALSLAIHNILSWLAILFTGLHAMALLWDSYYTYTLADLTIPFVGPYRAGWVGLGIISFYVMFMTSISFYFRKQIGQARWRQLHYLTFLAYALVTIHGVTAGTDSGNAGMQLLYWGSGIGIMLLILYRAKIA